MSMWKRLKRFSLRFFLVMITVACVCLAVIDNRARNQARLVEKIQDLGGNVFYDFQVSGSDFDSRTDSPFPDWMIDQAGIDMFHSVVYVDLRKSQVNNEPSLYFLVEPVVEPVLDFFEEGEFVDQLVKHCPNIESLKVSRRFAGDVAAEKIGRLKGLKHLLFEKSSRLTDRGIENLKACEKLEILLLNGPSELTDRSLETIGQFPNLERLTLESPLFTDEGVAHLSELQSLEVVHLLSQNLTDNSLEILSNLEHINDLYLGMKKFSEKGFKKLAKLQSLEQVYLDADTTHEVLISKDTWDSLSDLPLKTVNIRPVKAPTNETQGLLNKNPSCQIFCGEK